MTASHHLPIRLHIEGWRGIRHSYAQIKHSDLPSIMARRANADNSAGFTPTDLAVIQAAEFEGPIDAVYRIYAPLSLEAHATLPTLTFAVTKFGLGTKDLHPAKRSRYAAHRGLMHTPNQCSKHRLVDNGVPANNIPATAPHVNTTHFHQTGQGKIEEGCSCQSIKPAAVLTKSLSRVALHARIFPSRVKLFVQVYGRRRSAPDRTKSLLKCTSP